MRVQAGLNFQVLISRKFQKQGDINYEDFIRNCIALCLGNAMILSSPFHLT